MCAALFNLMSKPDYRGMTVNERLFADGLVDEFDRALAHGDTGALAEMLHQVEVEPGLANTLLAEGYECWFCGEAIDWNNAEALRLVVAPLWAREDDCPSQELYAHFSCAQSRMAGARMSLEAETFVSESPDE